MGCHVVPSYWATCLPVIVPYHHSWHIVNMSRHLHTAHSAATSASVQPSHLPRHLPYNHVSCHITSILHSHPSTSSSLQPNFHPYYHVSACHWVTSCMDCHVSSIQCHMSNLYMCQLILKMSNFSDTCHLLVTQCQHDDVMLMSPVVLLTSTLTLTVDFD
jgi:hypothetical protein